MYALQLLAHKFSTFVADFEHLFVGWAGIILVKEYQLGVNRDLAKIDFFPKRSFKVGHSRSGKIFAKLKLSPVVFKNIASSVCLVFKNENK